MPQDPSQQPVPKNSYCEFFGFSEKPFELTPDPGFFFMGRAYRETLAAILYGIRERRGLTCIVGEVGVGKTTLLNALRQRLDPRTKLALVANTELVFDEILSGILVDLSLADPGETFRKIDALRRLSDCAMNQLSSGGNVVILVDEAQNLGTRALENLRLLSNLETSKHKLIQIVLSGQPELDLKLRRPELRQLEQRISVKRYLTPLNERETLDYIQDRLLIANYKGPVLFSRRALQLVWEHSGGIPRRINLLCESALMIAYSLQKQKVKSAVMEEAIEKLNWNPFSGEGSVAIEAPIGGGGHPGRPFLRRSAFTAGLLAALGLILYLGLQISHGPTTGEAILSLTADQREKILPADPSLSRNGPPDAFARTEPAVRTPPPGDHEAADAETKTSPVKEAIQPVLEGTGEAGRATALQGKRRGVPMRSPYVVQLGAFRESGNAEELARELNVKGYDARIDDRGPDHLHRVQIRGYPTRADALKALGRFRKEGFDRVFMRRLPN